MSLPRARCEDLLRACDHGVLATRSRARGVDAVPVCFVADGMRVAVPVDLVKPKTSSVLQRQRNLDADPRAVLLCEHWDPLDWSRLWWVRASMTRIDPDQEERGALECLLARKYVPYRSRPFADLMVFDVTDLSGWSAEPGDPAQT